MYALVSRNYDLSRHWHVYLTYGLLKSLIMHKKIYVHIYVLRKKDYVYNLLYIIKIFYITPSAEIRIFTPRDIKFRTILVQKNVFLTSVITSLAFGSCCKLTLVRKRFIALVS